MQFIVQLVVGLACVRTKSRIFELEPFDRICGVHGGFGAFDEDVLTEDFLEARRVRRPLQFREHARWILVGPFGLNSGKLA